MPNQRDPSPDQPHAVSSGSTSLAAERREARRYSFVCHAELIDVAGSTRISARTSDLSLRGCYIDTLNPFPVGTQVRVQLVKSDEKLEFRAQVTSCHMGSGMGLLFERLTSAQKKTVASWLEKDSSGSETSFRAPASPGPSSDPAKKGVRFAEKLVKMLEGRGILSPSEAADLLRELES